MKELLAAQEQLHANTVSCIMTAMTPLLAISTASLSGNGSQQQQRQQLASSQQVQQLDEDDV